VLNVVRAIRSMLSSRFLTAAGIGAIRLRWMHTSHVAIRAPGPRSKGLLDLLPLHREVAAVRSALATALLLTACAPWTVVQRAEPNPLTPQSFVAVLPLDWNRVMIDGLTEPGWNETNDTDMKREWVIDRQIAIDEFHNGVYGEAGGKLAIAPGNAPLTIKSSVLELKTGGIRPLIISVRAQLVDSQGTVLEEITTEVKESRGRHRWGLFRERLSNASRACGANIAEYFVERARR
jgi:hypothetical protein